jgi:hypothetical protein
LIHGREHVSSARACVYIYVFANLQTMFGCCIHESLWLLVSREIFGSVFIHIQIGTRFFQKGRERNGCLLVRCSFVPF